MGQLIAVILNIMVMLLVPLGLLQVHTVVQARNELLEVSAVATKYVSNHGGTSAANLQQEVRALIARELREKKFSFPDQELSVSVTRTRSLDPVLWSHEDEFVVELAIPYPRFTSWIPMPADSLQVQRIGTVNIMDYDL
ncbi:hypothetical protein ABE237_22700 [Brevibacillus formosus]|uniref:hypothetical protein n=1 Tax=Brevibacillus TaxID=55080 RepID=UPI000D0E9DC3|nr:MULTISPECIES: hypothetical protein [Brevibacillus]MBG9941741.1 hypothetical protein [Brevibacillus formosus]MED1947753.1 hypothetical protein [Brevibacillus formosus]MED2001626.1 hypothetical protein [Brevibacillus formosus]MED2085847.1 hypothetical protein [Brevibacillus formosus]PSK12195.1 hypothetical protein C7R94_24720 [Brevibacillus sp. NRRL NRS-603]